MGFAPGWKTGACDQKCQELVSAADRGISNAGANANNYAAQIPIYDCSTDDYTQSRALTAN
jgi:hypothetical protein